MEHESLVQPSEETLPELTNELLSAHTRQSSELEQAEAALERLNGELATAEEQLAGVSGEVAGVVRSVCLQEDQQAGLQGQCAELEKEVAALVLVRQQLLLNHRNASQQREKQEGVRQLYQEKMKRHREKTKELEQLSPTQIEIENVKGKIHELKLKREEHINGGVVEQMLSGEKQQCLLQQIAALQASTQVQAQDNTTLKTKIAANIDCVTALKKDLESGKKRQAAQLRRMQRLVSEAQVHRRQWADRAHQLKTTIRQVKGRIED